MTPRQLVAARNALGLSQEALAEALGVHRVTVSIWERSTKPLPRLVELAMEALRRRRSSRRP